MNKILQTIAVTVLLAGASSYSAALMVLEAVAVPSKPELYMPTTVKKPFKDIERVDTLTHARLSPVSRQALTYVFKGQILENGLPCNGADVVIRVWSARGETYEQVRTKADGQFQINLAMANYADEAVDWSIEAQSPARIHGEAFGRRIVTSDDTNLSIERSLDLSR